MLALLVLWAIVNTTDLIRWDGASLSGYGIAAGGALTLVGSVKPGNVDAVDLIHGRDGWPQRVTLWCSVLAAGCECEESSNCGCSCSAQHIGNAQGNGRRGGTDEVSGRYCTVLSWTDTDVRQSGQVSCSPDYLLCFSARSEGL